MRVSRPCYDKPHRCPSWAGGGTRGARRYRCRNGRLRDVYRRRGWSWRFDRCDACDVLTLPYVVRFVDPGYWRWQVRWAGRWLRDRVDP